MGFFADLDLRSQQVDSLLCLGLDPHLPDLDKPTPDAARDFCLRLIDAAGDLVAAVKPNAAFFEFFGADGWRVMAEVIAAVPPGIPVILDAKRGDIASTAQAYAHSAFETLGANAITLSPYLGRDSITPFLVDPDRGVFLLCKTSNPGAADLQDLPLGADEGGDQLVYEAVAQMVQGWVRSGALGSPNLGLVVGATYPDSLQRVRRLAPDLWILAPGIGAQGGDLAAALRAGLRRDGLGLLLPVSRGVARAADPRQAAVELRDTINRVRESVLRSPVAGTPEPPPTLQDASVQIAARHPWAALADGLLDAGCVRFGQFKLKSGLISPIYLDLRRLVGYPRLLDEAARAYWELLRGLKFDRLAALPYAALPIGTAVSLRGGWPLIYPRKETKDYGTMAEIEGVFTAGERVVVIDDLATTGGSKFEAIGRLAAAGLQVSDVVVLIDRQSGASESLAQRGYRLHSVFRLTELLTGWEKTGRVQADDLDAVRRFIRGTAPT